MVAAISGFWATTSLTDSMATAVEAVSAGTAAPGLGADRFDPRQRVQRWLESFGCSPAEASAGALALETEAAARALEPLLSRRTDAAEVLGQELLQAGPGGVRAQRSLLRGFGLVLEELSDDVLEGAYWAEKFDELSERSSGSFNTLHKYSCDVSNTPFPFFDVLEALRLPLQQDFGLAPEGLRLHAAFFIHYGPGWNTALRRHVDSSLLTVNICLRTAALVGCDVRFFGARRLLDAGGDGGSNGDGDRDLECSALVDVPSGWALLHWGDHEHETAPWEDGERWSVILWFKER